MRQFLIFIHLFPLMHLVLASFHEYYTLMHTSLFPLKNIAGTQQNCLITHVEFAPFPHCPVVMSLLLIKLILFSVLVFSCPCNCDPRSSLCPSCLTGCLSPRPASDCCILSIIHVPYLSFPSPLFFLSFQPSLFVTF